MNMYYPLIDVKINKEQSIKLCTVMGDGLAPLYVGLKDVNESLLKQYFEIRGMQKNPLFKEVFKAAQEAMISMDKSSREFYPEDERIVKKANVRNAMFKLIGSTKTKAPKFTIRWMGAFRGHEQGLHNSLMFELGERGGHVAAEPIWSNSKIKAKVGLLVDPRAIIKLYSSDVWSVGKGKTLVATRPEGQAYSRHGEAFCRRQYIGVVFKSTASRKEIAKAMSVAKTVKTRLFKLTGKTIKEVIM